MFDPEGFNVGAERAIFWTREQLEKAVATAPSNERRWEFLGELPRSHRMGAFLFVHGSPRNPLSEYIFPEDIYNPPEDGAAVPAGREHCFQGHTHVPGVFTEGFQFYSPEEIDNEYTLGDGKLMINVGSVGQPRDGDNRACYVVLDDGQADESHTAEFFRAAINGGPDSGDGGGGDKGPRPRCRPRSSARSGSRTGGSSTISRRPSKRFTPSPSLNRFWAIGSARGVDPPRRQGRVEKLRDDSNSRPWNPAPLTPSRPAAGRVRPADANNQPPTRHESLCDGLAIRN